MKINHLDAFSDNYIWVMESEGKIAIVDPGDAKPIHAVSYTHLTLPTSDLV